MKRTDNLTLAMNVDTTEVVNKQLATTEKRLLDRKLAQLQFDIEDKEAELEKRMSSNVQITWDTVKINIGDISKLKNEITSLKAFITEYYGD